MEGQDAIDAVPDDEQTPADAGATALQSLDSGIVPDISPSSL